MKYCFFTLMMALASLFSGCGDPSTCEQTGCDDGNICTVDVCNAESGTCEASNAPDGFICEIDGAAAACVDGACVSRSCDGIECDDGNPCTQNSCLEGLGACVAILAPDLTVCEVDGSFGRCGDAECDLSIPPLGEAEFQLTLTDAEASLVGYELECASDLVLSGFFARFGDDWEASLTLPAGACSIQVLVRDDDGEVICTASETFTILPSVTTTLQFTLTCNT